MFTLIIRTGHMTKKFRNDRVMRWRLSLEECDITWHYVQGEKNVVADALSRLLITTTTSDDEDDLYLEETFEIEPAQWRRFHQPVTFLEIGKEQCQDPYVQRLQQEAPHRLGEAFEDLKARRGADHVLTEMDIPNGTQRIVVPQKLRARLMEWYHAALVHPGSDRSCCTIRQHCAWPHMHQDVRTYCKHCHDCQKAK